MHRVKLRFYFQPPGCDLTLLPVNLNFKISNSKLFFLNTCYKMTLFLVSFYLYNKNNNNTHEEIFLY